MRKNTRLTVMAISILLLVIMSSGCTTTRYTNPRATQQQLMEDRYQCLQETKQSYNGKKNSDLPNCEDFNACLAGRGYTKADEGELTVSSDVKIRCNIWSGYIWQ